MKKRENTPEGRYSPFRVEVYCFIRGSHMF
jgi:hypothetical protein